MKIAASSVFTEYIVLTRTSLYNTDLQTSHTTYVLHLFPKWNICATLVLSIAAELWVNIKLFAKLYWQERMFDRILNAINNQERS